MSKSSPKPSKRNNPVPPRRDVFTITNRRLSSVRVSPLDGFDWKSPAPTPIEDGRFFSPAPARSGRLNYKSPVTFSGRPARVVAPSLRSARVARSSSVAMPSVWSGLANLVFKAPKRVVVCLRRSVRREVLLAKGKGGANRYRPPRSYVRC